MYHIPNDLRAKKSAAAIYSSLLVILKSKSLNDITISDITKESGISRSTFYRLFDNVTDVVIWKCDQIYEEAINSSKKNNSFEETFVAFAESWLVNRTLLEAISGSSRMDIIYKMHTSHIDYTKEYLSKSIKIRDSQLEYVLAILTWILPACVQVLLEHPEDLHSVYRHMHDSFSSIEKIFR